MLGRAALVGLALLLGACTRSLVLRDVVPDGASEGGAGSGSGDGAGGRDGYACADVQPVGFYPRTAQVLIMLDYSAAMREPFEGTTRLAAAQSALATAIHLYGRLVMFGLEQFPAASDDALAFSQCRYRCCAGSVRVPIRLSNEQGLVSQLQCTSSSSCPSPDSVDAPIPSAFDRAYQYLSQSDYWQGYDRYVWLVTASEPSCAAEGETVCNSATYAADELHEAASTSILTVGWAPEAPRSCWPPICSYLQPHKYKLPVGDCLNALPTSEALNTYVQSFAQALARRTCTLNLAFPITDSGVRSTVSVKIDDQEVKRREGNGPDGWEFVDQQRIELYGADCERIVQTAESKSPSISIAYPCSGCAWGTPYQCYGRP